MLHLHPKMFKTVKNIKLVFKVTIGLFVALVFSLYAKDIEKNETTGSFKLVSLQQSVVNHSEKATLSLTEYHFTALERRLSQEHCSTKRFFVTKIAVRINSVTNERAHRKNIALSIVNSHILIGKLNLLKIISLSESAAE